MKLIPTPEKKFDIVPQAIRIPANIKDKINEILKFFDITFSC